MALNILTHWLHLIAAITWVGGTLFASLVLQPVLRFRLSPQERMPIYHEIGNRFKAIQLAALLTLVATGAFKLWRLQVFPEVLHTLYGRILEIKLALVLIVTVLTVLHSYVWGPRLTALAGRPNSAEFGVLMRRLVFWGRLNLILMLAIILCAAGLRFA